MKALKNFICITMIFSFFLNYSFIFPVQATSSTELNWYYTAKGKGIPSEQPKESASFLSTYNSYYLGKTNDKVIYLTFDEGYENGNTGKILDILKETNVPAAFFVTKPYITSQPELIKRMADEGHIVGNHTVHHPSMASITDSSLFTAEFTGVEEAYKSITGSDMPKFFRPPMGKYSELSLDMTNKLGYKTIFWSFAYKDWLTDAQPSQSYAIEKIINGAHPGAVILLHAVSDTNTAILKTVIQQLRNEGYTFKSLNELDQTIPTETEEERLAKLNYAPQKSMAK